jgi:hypothetical protein
VLEHIFKVLSFFFVPYTQKFPTLTHMTVNDNYPKANGLSLLKHFLHEEQNHAVGDLTTSCAVYRPG